MSSNGIEGLETCKNYRETIHLLVTDMIMPRMGGYELAEKAVPLRSGMRIVFISGYSDGALDPHVFGWHSAFLQKPFSMDALARAIRNLLQEKLMAGA